MEGDAGDHRWGRAGLAGQLGAARPRPLHGLRAPAQPHAKGSGQVGFLTHLFVLTPCTPTRSRGPRNRDGSLTRPRPKRHPGGIGSPGRRMHCGDSGQVGGVIRKSGSQHSLCWQDSGQDAPLPALDRLSEPRSAPGTADQPRDFARQGAFTELQRPRGTFPAFRPQPGPTRRVRPRSDPSPHLPSGTWSPSLGWAAPPCSSLLPRLPAATVASVPARAPQSGAGLLPAPGKAPEY